ncbi:MAG: hypothetical protein ACO25F_03960 [Erythrobacter sp.]
MPDLRKFLLAVLPLPLLAACVGTAKPPLVVPDRPKPVVSTPRAPTQVPPSNPAPPTAGFIAPQVMRMPGLENVIGTSAAQLERRFGKPRLDVIEGDARKLQFSGEPCVLDVYLYPMQPGGSPVATHVEARRASDGREVDRASCVRALSGS